MAASKKTAPRRLRNTKTAATVPAGPAQGFRLLLWLVFFLSVLFFIPQSLDRYLVPRFLLLSAIALAGVLGWWRWWQQQASWRLNGFDVLLVLWLGWNAASVSWAFSWSEGVFFTGKVLLFLVVYGFVRQALRFDEPLVRSALFRITNALTLVVSVLIFVQIGLAFLEYGLDNQRLYAYASGVFGNKGLATDFLFFLLVFHVWFQDQFRKKTVFWLSVAALLALILLLQTRTVYLAVAASALFYFPLRAGLEPGFRPVFLRRILPAGVLGLALLVGLIAWKGRGSSLGERLNPATYLESASAVERRFVWAKTDMLNEDHFWLGVGNGSWKFLFPSKSISGGYRLQEKDVVFTRVHNDYLEVRSEMGIIGAVLFIGLFVSAFLLGGMALRRHTDARVRHDLLALLTGLLGYCIIQYFDFPRERIEMQILLALLFAAIMHYSRPVWEGGPGFAVSRWSGLILVLLAGGLSFNVAMGWQRLKGEIHTVLTLKAQASGNLVLLQREAAAAYSKFYEYNDTALPLPWYEGIAFYQMNRVPEALAAFETAYRLNPWSFQVINNYASALVRSERYEEAVPLYEKALEINPKYNEGKYNIAFARYSMGQYAEAQRWLAQVDTLANPETEIERQKNQTVLQQKAGLEKAIKQRIEQQ